MPVTTVCRDCLFEGNPEEGRDACPSCGGARLIRHDELGGLTVAHLDCDAFYASVEKRDDPSLADKPVIVGGAVRGVVAACCYIARRYGVRSAMPMFKARRACPDAVIIRPDMAKYAAIGREVRAMMHAVTPLVEPLSIDEAFLDLAGTERLHGGSAARSLAGLARRIEEEIGITASIGLSANKSLAKIASDLDKPRGFAVIGRAEARAFLADKPVSLIFGVGRAFEKTLVRDGFRLIGDLAAVPEAELTKRYGAIGTRLARFSRGEDARAVTPGRRAKSVSSETTFAADESDLAMLEAILWRQCERVARRLRAEELAGRTVVLKLKTHDFRIITRRRSLTGPTQLAAVLYEATAPLLARESGGRRFRLLGVGVADLVPGIGAEASDLFGEDRRRAASLERAMDDLHQRFGGSAPVKGRSLAGKRRREA